MNRLKPLTLGKTVERKGLSARTGRRMSIRLSAVKPVMSDRNRVAGSFPAPEPVRSTRSEKWSGRTTWSTVGTNADPEPAPREASRCCFDSEIGLGERSAWRCTCSLLLQACDSPFRLLLQTYRSGFRTYAAPALDLAY